MMMTAAAGMCFGWQKWNSAHAADGAANTMAILVPVASALSNISFEELRSVFLQERNTIEKTRVVPLNHPPGSPARIAFDRMVLGFEPDEMARYWVDRRIRGMSGAPRSISPELVVRVVARLPGALAYAPLPAVAAGSKPLSVDGKPPHHLNYPLRF
jgi:hypothetical protein